MDNRNLDRRRFLKGPLTLVEGVLRPKPKGTASMPASKNLRLDDQVFLEALDDLLEKHRQKLVEELAQTLTEKISMLPVVVNDVSDTITKSPKVSKVVPKISIDESVFVIDEKIDGIQKGFSELAETKTEQDADAVKALNKLRSLKKGS